MTEKYANGKSVWIVLGAVLLCIAGFILYKTLRIDVSGMNSTEMIRDYTSDKKNIALTVGVIENGKMDMKLYREDGTEAEFQEYEYETGSIAKTFTCALLCSALEEGKVDLDDSISKYLDLEQGKYYPTVLRLATHTSGYGSYPEEIQEKEIEYSAPDYENPYFGFGRTQMLESLRTKTLEDKDYSWEYSNYGISVLGYVLAEIYEIDYETLMKHFLKEEMGLSHTYFGSNKYDVKGYDFNNSKYENWDWEKGDAFLPAAGLVSTAADLLKYIELQMSGEKSYLRVGQDIHSDSNENGSMDMGLGWMLETNRNIIWHGGSTGCYHCFIGFDRQKKTGVVVLSNYMGDGDLNAANIGMKKIEELISQ